METLMTQMQEIKSATGSAQPTSAASRVIEKEVADPRVVEENEKLKKELANIKEQLATASSGGAPAPSSSGGGGGSGNESAELDKLRGKFFCFSQAALGICTRLGN